jgi:hypothetical protein
MFCLAYTSPRYSDGLRKKIVSCKKEGLLRLSSTIVHHGWTNPYSHRQPLYDSEAAIMYYYPHDITGHCQSAGTQSPRHWDLGAHGDYNDL